jgi:hypothetical protein
MKISIISVCLIVAMIFIAGCASQSRLAMDYGTSYELQKFNQILNAEAEKNLEPVVGINGEAARASIDKYKKGFEKQKTAATVYNFNLGQ